MRQNVAMLAFNRGVISPLAMARVDLDRLQLSAETQTNWIPRVLGSMMLRPGTEYIHTIPSKPLHIPFIASSTQTAIIEITSSGARIFVDESAITRPQVTATITNGSFTSNVTGWTDTDEAGATSSWESSGYLELLGTGTNAAKRNQLVTVVEANTIHSLAIQIARGPVRIKVGTSAGDDTYVSELLLAGYHSLAFTPTGNFYIEFSNILDRSVFVDSVALQGSGGDEVLNIATPWAENDLQYIRKTQSADVIYIACDGYQQRRFERRDNDSWSLVIEEPLDGPFGEINTTPISISSSALTGNVTLTASRALFVGSSSEHSGQLIKITSAGQIVQSSVTAEDTFTDSILVTGVDTSREFTRSIAGTWVATVTMQRSVDDATWVDVGTFTANTSGTFDDGLDNVEYYYRIGVKAGEFTSGTIQLGLSYSGGNRTGIVQIRRVVSSTSATGVVISALGGTVASRDWYISQWSEDYGFPTAVSLYEGRVWYAGTGKIWGSVSDAYSSFDDEVVGDSSTINRNIGEGPVDSIHWIAPLQRMIIGTTGSEISARSTSFDEPLTYVNFNTKDISSRGSANVDIVKNGKQCVFVQRSGATIYQLQYAAELSDYDAVNLTELAPEITEPSVVRLAIQQEPDVRIHCVRSDGKVAILIKDEAEKTLAWVLYETDGVVEDAFIMPGDNEDKVYYAIKRTINGSTVRYLERWALESEGQGGTNNKLCDSFIYETGVSKSTISGLSHLEGESVVLWGNGKNLGSYTVTSGSITPSETVTSYCVGLPYSATFKSSKLAYAASLGTAINQVKKVTQVGFVARNTHMSGITYGPSETEQWDLPAAKDFQVISADTVHEEFDTDTFPFGGHWDSDARLIIKAAAPKPVTLLAVVLGIQTNDKA